MSKHKPRPQEKKVSDETQILLWVICFVLGALLVADSAVHRTFDQYFLMGSAIVLISIWFGTKAFLSKKTDIRNKRKK